MPLKDEASCTQCGANLTHEVIREEGKADRIDGPARYSFTAFRSQPMDGSLVFCSYDCGEAYAATLAEK